jgi:hypothetical protein
LRDQVLYEIWNGFINRKEKSGPDSFYLWIGSGWGKGNVIADI